MWIFFIILAVVAFFMLRRTKIPKVSSGLCIYTQIIYEK